MAGRSKDIAGAYNSVTIDVSGGNQTLAAGCRGFHVGVAGNIKVDFVGGSTATMAVNAGATYAYQINKVYQTGTTATGCFALY